MKTVAIFFSVITFFSFGFASNSDAGLLSLTIEEINVLNFSEKAVSIVCNQFSMTNITGVNDSSTYSLASNDGKQKKITVKLDKSIPKSGELRLTLDTLPTWTAHPNLFVSRVRQDIVTAIPANSIGSNLGVNYTLEFPRTTKATKKPEDREVTYTLSDD